MKIIFFVLASNDPINESDLLAQKLTWASDVKPNIEIIWVRGSDSTTYKYEDFTLYVPCPEGYKNILEKTILAAKWLKANRPADIYIRSNTSTYFNLEKINIFLAEKFTERSIWGGHLDYCKDLYFGGKKPYQYVTGTGIFLTSKALDILTSLNQEAFKSVPDDVALSRFFELLGHAPLSMPRNNLGSTHIFFPTIQIRAKSSDNFKLAGRRMRIIHLYFHSSFWARLFYFFIINFSELRYLRYRPKNFIFYLKRNRGVFFDYLNLRFRI